WTRLLRTRRSHRPASSPSWSCFSLRPHLNSLLTGTVPLGPTLTDTVDLTTGSNLGSVLSPQVELGYRLPRQMGEFLVSYRFEDADRTSFPTSSPGGLSQRDRLDVHVLNLDWGSRNPFFLAAALGPGWDIRFNVGIRLASIYFDTQRDF